MIQDTSEQQKIQDSTELFILQKFCRDFEDNLKNEIRFLLEYKL